MSGYGGVGQQIRLRFGIVLTFGVIFLGCAILALLAWYLSAAYAEVGNATKLLTARIDVAEAYAMHMNGEFLEIPISLNEAKWQTGDANSGLPNNAWAEFAPVLQCEKAYPNGFVCHTWVAANHWGKLGGLDKIFCITAHVPQTDKNLRRPLKTWEGKEQSPFALRLPVRVIRTDNDTTADMNGSIILLVRIIPKPFTPIRQ